MSPNLERLGLMLSHASTLEFGQLRTRAYYINHLPYDRVHVSYPIAVICLCHPYSYLALSCRLRVDDPTPTAVNIANS